MKKVRLLKRLSRINFFLLSASFISMLIFIIRFSLFGADGLEFNGILTCGLFATTAITTLIHWGLWYSRQRSL